MTEVKNVLRSAVEFLTFVLLNWPGLGVTSEEDLVKYLLCAFSPWRAQINQLNAKPQTKNYPKANFITLNCEQLKRFI